MPPSQSDGLVEHNGRPGTVRGDDIVVLLRLIGDGWDACWGDVRDDCIRLGVRDVVDGCEEARDLGDDRVAGADSLGVFVDPTVKASC